jgi:hypothetical protein
MTELNLDAWREVRDLIASVRDDQINMGRYLGSRSSPDFPFGRKLTARLKHSCNTVGCIAGFTVLAYKDVMPGDLLEAAAGILGLSLGKDEDEDGWWESTAYYVFMGEWVPECKSLDEVTRQDVLAYMDRVIETRRIRHDDRA